MQNIQIFNNPEFGEIRTIIIDGKDYFYGVDVAKALMYERPSKAVSDHCKGILTLDTLKNEGGYPEKLIPEGDIYRLTVKASEQNNNKEIKQKAEKFEQWIFDEVLPALRKTGTYSMNERNILDAAVAGNVADLGRVTERIMKGQGSAPHKIAEAFLLECNQFGIILPVDFVKVPEYEQMELSWAKEKE